MYRNCFEHPIIAEILQSGEKTDRKITNSAMGDVIGLTNVLQAEATEYISQEEFEDICMIRLAEMAGKNNKKAAAL